MNQSNFLKMTKKFTIGIIIAVVLIAAGVTVFASSGGSFFKGSVIKTGTPHGEQQTAATDCAGLKAQLDAAKAKFDACKDYYCANSASITYKVIYDEMGTNLKTCNIASYGHQQYNEMINKLGPMKKNMFGKLSVALIPIAVPNKNQTVVIGTSNQPYLGFQLTAINEPIKIYSIKMSITGQMKPVDFKGIKLLMKEDAIFTPNNPDCSAKRCDYLFNLGNGWIVNPESPVAPLIFADINDEGVANLGDNFKMQINDAAVDIDAVGVYSAKTLTAKDKTGDAVSPGMTYIMPFDVMVTGDMPSAGSLTTQTVTVGTTLGRFKLTNNGSAVITLTNVKFTDIGLHTGTATRYTLYTSNQNSSDYTANTIKTSTMDSVDFGAITPIIIDGGAYRYLTVQISQLGAVSGDSFRLAVASLGDFKYSVAESGLGYSGNPSTDQDLFDNITGLYVNGTPILGTIAKN